MTEHALTVRDRPWAFWGGAAAAFPGAGLLLTALVVADRNAREREAAAVAEWAGAALLALGTLGMRRGRAARFDPRTRQLLRGGVVVHDLGDASGLVAYRPIDGSPAHYVVLLLGPSDPTRQGATTVAELRRDGDRLVPLAQGVPPAAARRCLLRWREALGVPVVLLPGVQFSLS